MRGVVALLVAGGAGLLPAVVGATLALVQGVPLNALQEEPLVIAPVLSACVFGLLSLFTTPLAIGFQKEVSPVPAAALLASVLSGLLSFIALLMTLRAADPLLWLAGIVLFFVPGPLIAATLAWLWPRAET